MATTTKFPQTIFRPISGTFPIPRRVIAGDNIIIIPSSSFLVSQCSRKRKYWAIKQSLVEVPQQSHRPSKSTVNVPRMVEFLYDEFPDMFDDEEILRMVYDERIMIRDPITDIHTLTHYLFYISLLKLLFRLHVDLHWVKQTGQYEITTRWSVSMRYVLLPWKPELVFTGTSLMSINPSTGKFCSHVDYWDSIKNNNYFSSEGLWDVIRQLCTYKTPNLETLKYQILKRATHYEVRRYEPFTVIETYGDKLSDSGHIFRKNFKTKKIPMRTPIFTKINDAAEESKVVIQAVLPQDIDLNSLTDAIQEKINLRKVEGSNIIAATLKFSGKPCDDVVKEKEKELRNSLITDGLRPRKGFLLARYNNDLGGTCTWDFIMRNEVLIWLEDFTLD